MSVRTLRILGIAFATALVVAACGDDDDTVTNATTEAPREPAGQQEPSEDEPAGEDRTPPVQEGETSLGTVLVDAAGKTLYAFTPDEGGTPTCTDACAELWPPLFTDSSELPDGLDPSVFSVVEHPSGEPQLSAGGWPLYYYASDAEPGDVNGHGVGGNWFAVAPDGSLVEEPAGAEGTGTGASSPGDLGY